MGKLITEQGSGVKAPAQSSRGQNTSVGSGARPTKSKIVIPTSAPMNPRTLGRKTPGALE